MKLSTVASVISFLATSQASLFPQSILQRFQGDSLPENVDITDYSYTKDYNLSESAIIDLFTLHKLLVDTSSNSFYEKEVALKLSHYLKSKNLTVDLQEVERNRYNVLAYKGSINDTKVVLNSHIDTVPPHIPYSIKDNGTKIYGRGSTDAKGPVAAQVIAFLQLLETEVDFLKDGDVSLLFVVGEENGGQGFQHAVRKTSHPNWQSVIVGEPTENKLGVGHKGVFHGVLNVTGLASHSGYPELGVDANRILVDVLHNLKGKTFPSDKLLGPSTLNFGVFEGGVAGNIISPRAHSAITFRVAGELESFKSIVQEAIDEVEGASKYAKFEEAIGVGPVFFKYDVEGFESIVLGYGTDAFSLNGDPVKNKFLYGPGTIHVAHGENEHVSTDDLIEAVDGYKRLVKHALGL